jgi:hypothetical protein
MVASSSACSIMPMLGVSPPSTSEAQSSTRSAPAFWAAIRPSVFSTQTSILKGKRLAMGLFSKRQTGAWSVAVAMG